MPRDMTDAAIRIEDLAKTYEGGKRALDGVTFDAPRGQIGELALARIEPCGHHVVEASALKAERSPVEIVVRDQAAVLLPAGAGEQDAEDCRVSGAGEAFELAEGR